MINLLNDFSSGKAMIEKGEALEEMQQNKNKLNNIQTRFDMKMLLNDSTGIICYELAIFLMLQLQIMQQIQYC